jgi:Tol biopolymer transport system component
VPTFSPDGQWIAFLSKDADTPPVVYGSGDLYVVRVDGSGLRKVNPSGTTFVATAANGRPMAWSPDGRQLVFSAIDGSLVAGRSAVYLASVDGGQPVRISPDGTWIAMVEWSPDGGWIIWGGADGRNTPTWIAHPDGSVARQLIGPGTPISGCCATWSPDGTRLLFERGGDTGGDLWTIDPNGTVLDQITRQPARYVWFSWARRP